MFNISLANKYSQWNEVQSTDKGYCLWVRGYAFIGEQFYAEKELAQYVSDCLGKTTHTFYISTLKNLIPKFNGGWALVYESDDIALAAVDRLRNIPLFYMAEDGKVFLSDDAMEVRKYLKKSEFDDICAAEFLVTGYVTGKDTLYKGLYQIQPGEILEIKTSSAQINSNRYYRFIHGDYFESDRQELEEELSELLHRMSNRYATALKGKTIVVPLSGGLDSRLLVAMFKKCGIENVICFSYGRQGNKEAEISRSVAKALGYKWLFCPYDSWYNWFRGEQYSSYIKYASGLSGISHEQDWPATKKILDNISDTNKEDMVFVPGHSADFLAGSHIPDELLFVNDDMRIYGELAVEAILSHHYNQWNWRSVCPHLKDSFCEHIGEILSVYPQIENKSQAIGAFETWDFESRQARFIVNSVRVYEFWGCKWMLPLWDNELTDFYSKIKLELRIRKTLYRSTLLKHIFTNQLKELAEIPISGLPLLESDTEGNKKGTYSSLLNSVYPTFRKFIPDFIANSHRASINLQNDSMNLYDIYTERGTTKLRDIIPLSAIDRMPTSVKKILRRNRKRPTTALSINGLHAAYHIALLLMD